MSTRLDARSPFVVDTHPLGRRPGALMEFSDSIPAPDHVANEIIGVPEGEPLDLDLRLESVVEGVLVTGSLQAHLVGQCARCLTEVEEDGDFSITELFNYEGREADEDDFFLEGDLLDLEPAVREAVALNLPFIPLCKPDCAGLCPQCGENLNDHPDHKHDEPIDPRWAALSALGDGSEADK